MKNIVLNISIAVYGLAFQSRLPIYLSKMIDNGKGGDCGNAASSAGVFAPVLDKLLPLARNAWGFGTALLIVMASLGGLYYALKGTAGASIGGSGMASGAIIGMVAIILMVLIAFLLLPQLSCLLQNSAPAAPF
jgi:hypothetical protein